RRRAAPLSSTADNERRRASYQPPTTEDSAALISCWRRKTARPSSVRMRAAPFFCLNFCLLPFTFLLHGCEASRDRHVNNLPGRLVAQELRHERGVQEVAAALGAHEAEERHA